MSAIGSFVVLRREGFGECVRLAGEVRRETSGKWIFRKQVTRGRDAFEHAWRSALVEDVPFDYSGYVLGNYLDAQAQVNGVPSGELESSPAALALNKVFTGAIPFEEPPRPFPVLEEQGLLAFCQSEYGVDAGGLREAILAAHEFYRVGLARLSDAHVVVFVIR
jgi:hypothetical protein